MVTFALPGDDVADDNRATPRSRAPLGFSQRGIGASPYGSFNKRAPTPHVRKTLSITRDEATSGGLNQSYNGARNIFRSSTIDSPPAARSFSPSLPNSTMKKIFEPAAGTPGSSRANRESIAHATPRGIASKAKDKDLFQMRIASPPPELTGAALTQKVPKDWSNKSSIYADQFLGHLCPPDLDDVQRRQFFCILDLRRLKYSADEIFLNKGWKMNVLNFAKEFEKTRGIILLHYGLYEFHNVKPSKEVLKRWRREHGLPDPDDEDEQAEPTPSKSRLAKKKRKAEDDSSSAPAESRAKRQATDGVARTVEPAVSTPSTALGKNKRKASVSEEIPDSQPAKKAASGARSMFEAAANKAAATPSATPSTFTPSSTTSTKSNATGGKRGTDNLFRSVFTAKAEAAQAASGNSNPFAYLSDNSSAKGSGVDADGESESDSDSEEGPATEQAEEPSAKKPAVSGAVEATVSSDDAGTRESTPGRSLFDRVTKDGDGQAVRAATPTETPAPSKDQTWNMGTTPIKFAPSTSTTAPSSLFAASKPAPAPSVFAAKSIAPSSLFGAAKQDKLTEKESSPEKTAEQAEKDGGESDKENDSQVSKKPSTENKPSVTQSPFANSLLGQKQTLASDPSNESAVSKPAAAPSLFGSSTAASPAPTSGLFGLASKPAEPAISQPSALQSTTLFGAQPAEAAKDPEKPTSSEPPKPATLFGSNGTMMTNKDTASSLFGAKAATTAATNLFGNTSSTPAKPIFGNPTSSTAPTAAPATLSAPGGSSSLFNFGGSNAIAKAPNGTSESSAKPLFGAPKSPPASAPSMFDGSPMKQDDKSPAKPLFSLGGNASNATSGLGSFNFNASSQATPSTNLFSNTPKPTDNTNSGGFSFGAASTTPAAQPSGGFSFNAGGSSSGAFSNPFASGGQGSASSKPTSGAFSFGASSAPSSGTSAFQFGGGSSTANGVPTFGAGPTAPAGAPLFGAGTSQAQPSAAPIFGGNQPSNAPPAFNFQPPSGGPSTGTNTPFSLGGGSSLATTPARGTPEPSTSTSTATAAAATVAATASTPATAASKTNGDDEEGENHEQVDLTKGTEEGEETLHEVRAKVLKFISGGSQEGDDAPKSKSPWVTQGVGALRLLKHQETGVVRLLLRAEPRGHVAMNRALLPDLEYKPDAKYVKLTTGGETGDGFETWMLQVKTKELAVELAEALEKHKESNKK